MAKDKVHPSTKHIIHAGMKIHCFTVIQGVRRGTEAATNLQVKWRVECECGTRLTVPQYYLTRKNPKTSCGCKNKTYKTIYKEEYGIWYMMHIRCEDPNHVNYRYYGGRGIAVCDRWTGYPEGFLAFCEDMGRRPSRDHSIDRIDNNRGYEPGNVRWATAKEQRANQRPRSQ